MKRITIILVLSFFWNLNCATFQVTSFKENHGDKTAQLRPVKDKNNNKCALIKINTNLKYINFISNQIVKSGNFSENQYKIYVEEGIKNITLKKIGYDLLDYTFPQKIKAGIVYTLNLDKNEFGNNGFNPEGFDIEGYDRDGYDKNGYNKEGFNREGFSRDGFDRDGYDKTGFNREGFNREGYTKEGINSFLIPEQSQNKKKYDPAGYDKDGYDKDGYDRDGYDKYGFDKDGYGREGYDKDGYNLYGFDRNNFNKYGYDKYGYDHSGFDQQGFSKDGYDKKGYDRQDYDRDGFNKDGYDRYGYDVYGYDKRGYNIDGYNPNKPIKMCLSVESAFPLGKFEDNSGEGYGIFLKTFYSLNGYSSVSLKVGYSYFTTSRNVPDDWTVNYMQSPLMLGYRIKFTNNMFTEGELGVNWIGAVIENKLENAVYVSYSQGIGYKYHDLEFAVGFNSIFSNIEKGAYQAVIGLGYYIY
ncbi:MAG: hypothetical protein JXR69_03260 [Candidatus Delongbacteria bacterium]|nr:hypothetical protein [Candidatus Delongbacteria bacterium]